MRKYRMDKETGKATFAIVQAEDEIAAIGMVVGASWAGARAMTSTSGPGHLADVRVRRAWRTTPSCRRWSSTSSASGRPPGLPTRTAQGDILFDGGELARRHAARACCCRRRVEECYEMAMEAFDLAERLQTIVYVMSDLDLGMNTWMSQPFAYPEKPLDRGKVLDEAKVRELGAIVGPLQGCRRRRHSVADRCRAPARRRSSRAARATTRWRSTPSGRTTTSRTSIGWRGSSRPRRRSCRRRCSSRTRARPSASSRSDRAHWACEESRDQLREEAGLKTSYLRLRAYPFTPELEAFIRRHDRIYVVEQNRDAQMLSLLRMDLDPALLQRLRSVLHYNGLPIDARSITEA